MRHCKHAETPMGVNEKLPIEVYEELLDVIIYRSLIGKLLYIVHTRPNIRYAVNFLSRFMNKPGIEHLNAIKRIVKHLAGIATYRLFYSKESCGHLEGFTDSDWGGSLSDRKSTLGMVCRIGTCSVTWFSKK